MNDKEKFDLEDEEELDFGEGATFTRIYTFLPYTHWRIKEILKDHYNAHLVCIRGYKEGRYPGYRQHYNIYNNTTGNLIAEHIYLDGLRSFFARQNFPLHKKKNERNKGAEKFLEIVKNLENEGK